MYFRIKCNAMTRYFRLLFGFLLLLGNVSAQNNTANYNLQDLSLQWETVENSYKGKAEFLSAFTLTSKSGTFPASGWKIYFNFPRMIQPGSVTGDVLIKHINGDFYQMSPKESFRGLATGQCLGHQHIRRTHRSLSCLGCES
ncbi:MAG: hypothetical protein EON98_02640 [Chitinophagaceae bacterium]|nr:MAG: hypothetical protein EON98_02640 [Chitinophagaceae bacterium]